MQRVVVNLLLSELNDVEHEQISCFKNLLKNQALLRAYVGDERNVA